MALYAAVGSQSHTLELGALDLLVYNRTLRVPFSTVHTMAAVNISEDGRKMFRIRKTLFKMLHNRGYLAPAEEFKMTVEQFVDRFMMLVSSYI